MNILLLGGTGFLGKYVVEELISLNYPFTVLTRNPLKLKVFSKEIPYIIGDLVNYETINFSNYTHIINCSGELMKEELMQKLHVDCIIGILTKLKNANPTVHWLQVSSVGVYGNVREGVVSENTIFAPLGCYETTKAAGESALKSFSLINNMKYTIIRPSNVFGRGMPNKSLQQLVSMLKKRLFFYIGNSKHDAVMNYVPVEDVASLIIACLHNSQAINQEFNISYQLPLFQFVQIVCDELNIKNNFYRISEPIIRHLTKLTRYIPHLPLTSSRVDALTMRVHYSNEKISKELNFRPKVGLALGIKNYIHSIENK